VASLGRSSEVTADDERLLREAEAIVRVTGGLAWVALEVDAANRRALFVAKSIRAQMAYNEAYTPVTWETCSLREWLNGPFFDALPAQTQARVIAVTNQNPNNPRQAASGWVNCEDGNPTEDRVFLLSLDEADKYFKSDARRVAKFKGRSGGWWLRSPGISDLGASNVFSVGCVNSIGSRVDDRNGVRPALWLSLDA
jgi:hypothetical protein